MPPARVLGRAASEGAGNARQFPPQQGQALVLGLLLSALAGAALLHFFGLGQVVAAKARQIHVLDAAAYSGALAQARALNMMAYLQRAQLGHQMALAHLATFGSWAAWGGNKSTQLAVGNPPAYLVAMFFGPAHGAAYLAASQAVGMQAWAGRGAALEMAYAAHDRLVHQALQPLLEDIAAHVPEQRAAAMREVVARNYGDENFELSVYDDGWPLLLQGQPASSQLALVRDIAARHRFLDPRDGTARNAWPVQARCPLRRHELRRRGSTQLDEQGRWMSTDTESLHALRSNRWLGCYYREYPMGWGWTPTQAGQAPQEPHVDRVPDDFSEQDYWRWVAANTHWDLLGGTDNPLATSRAVQTHTRWQGGGLPRVSYDVNPAATAAALRFGVRLTRLGPQGLSITAHSAAESHFRRPSPRRDGKHENANLFHPYWNARLASADGAPAQRGRP